MDKPRSILLSRYNGPNPPPFWCWPEVQETLVLQRRQVFVNHWDAGTIWGSGVQEEPQQSTPASHLWSICAGFMGGQDRAPVLVVVPPALALKGIMLASWYLFPTLSLSSCPQSSASPSQGTRKTEAEPEVQAWGEAALDINHMWYRQRT